MTLKLLKCVEKKKLEIVLQGPELITPGVPAGLRFSFEKLILLSLLYAYFYEIFFIFYEDFWHNMRFYDNTSGFSNNYRIGWKNWLR